MVRLREKLRFPERLEMAPASVAFRVTLALMALLAFLYYYCIVSRSQYLAGHMQGDVAERFNFMISRMLEGAWFDNPHTENSFLSTHVMFWMVPTSLLYRIHDGLMTLVFLFDAALALAIVPLGLLARRITGRESAALAICFLYGINLLTGSLVLSAHPEAFFIGLWFTVFWAVEAKSDRWMWLAAAAMTLVKEDAALWLGAYALWAWAVGRLSGRKSLALGGLAVAMGVFFLIVTKSFPVTEGFEHNFFWMERLAPDAATPGEAILYLITHPWVPFIGLLTPVWGVLIVAGGLLCLAGWRSMLLTLPAALIFFTSHWEPFNRLLYYYGYPFLPPLMLALCEAIRNISGAPPGRARWGQVMAGFLVATALFQFFFLPTRKDGEYLWPYREDPRAALARDFVQQAVPREPANIRVATQQTLAPYLPRGRNFVPLQPENLGQVDRVVMDLKTRAWDLSPERHRALLDTLVYPAGDWNLELELDGLLYFRRKTSN